MKNLEVTITGKAANNFLAQYGYSKNPTFPVYRLVFERGLLRQFSIAIPMHITGFKYDTVADFSGKEGKLNGIIEF